jgi:ParB family chromosome partitioning protein
MAGVKSNLLAGAAASMTNRLPDPDSTSAPPAGKSSIERQSQGRKRLDAAAVIRVDRIIPDPNQPRAEFDPEDLARLAESLRERGQLQPIRVRWDDALDRYIVVVGERRWRSAQIAGLETLACVVVHGEPTADDLLEDQLVENCLRVDLKPIEQAKAYRRLIASRSLSHRQLAERLQIGHASITRALALLDLPESVQAKVEQGVLPPATAYEVSKIEDADTQQEVAKRIVAEKLTREDAAEAVREATKSSLPRGSKGRGASKSRPPRPRTFRLAGGKVTIEPKRAGGTEALLALIEELASMLRAELKEAGVQDAA